MRLHHVVSEIPDTPGTPGTVTPHYCVCFALLTSHLTLRLFLSSTLLQVVVWNTAKGDRTAVNAGGAGGVGGSGAGGGDGAGEVDDDPLVACTTIDDYFHREPIISVNWLYSMDEGDYQLVSISGEGKVLFWSLSNNLSHPVRGYDEEEHE